jgi:hypothetical protein
VTLPGTGPALALEAWSSCAGIRGGGMTVVDRLVASGDLMAAAGANPYVLCVMSTITAVWAGFAGDIALATEHARDAVDFARESGSPSQLGAALFALGNATDVSDSQLALQCYDESIALTRTGAGTTVYGVCLAFAARLRHELGETARALEQAVESIRFNQSMGELMQIMNGVAVGIAILADLGEHAVAASLLAGNDRFNADRGTAWGEDDPRWRLGPLRELLHERLDDEAYERAVAVGAAMTNEELVAYCTAEMTRVRASLT